MSLAPSSLSHEAALEYLVGRIDYERNISVPYTERAYKLQRMCDLLDRLGRPQDRLPIIHIAGTKGKGSTSAMVAAMLTAAGYRTGLFTSPHLERLEERFVVDGQPCTGNELAQLIYQLRPVVDELDAAVATGEYEIGPTYFELTTAAALVHFVRRGVDAAVLEVGMGGRLDSTNVCQPRVSVVTSISFDHTKQLGNTLTEIAGEKAGIIKPGVPVISGVLADEARVVIQRVSDQHGCCCMQLGREFRFEYHATRDESTEGNSDYSRIDFQSDTGEHRDLRGVEIGLLGRHQGANAAIAIATINELIRQGWKVDEAAVRKGLRELRWPARVEIVGRSPTVILDAAHNVASIQALNDTIDESFPRCRRRLVFASTRDKDLAGMIQLIVPYFDQVVFTRYQINPRGVPADQLLEIAQQVCEPAIVASRCTVAHLPVDAWQHVRSSADASDLICIAGSFFIAAEMRAVATQRS